MTTGLVPAGAKAEWQSFRAAVNATSPFWNGYRSALGYFVVEHCGQPCWVGRTSGAGLKVALRSWIEAGAPGEHCSWSDLWESRILFVAFPDDIAHEALMPGRVI
jgi:hypothetical protein